MIRIQVTKLTHVNVIRVADYQQRDLQDLVSDLVQNIVNFHVTLL